MNTLAKTALIAGASGLTGSALVNWMLQDNYYSEIKLLVRSKLPVTDDRISQIETDFEQIEKLHEQIKADHIFCTLGATMKKAGSREAFRKVDYEYPFRLAAIARLNNAEKFLIVTAIGAHAQSPFFYNRVKGETEQALMTLGLPHLYIFRPALLTGNRKEYRPGEDVARVIFSLLNHLLIGPMKKYRSIHANAVAFAMKHTACFDNSRFRIFNSDEIQHIFNQYSQTKRNESRH
jgi:uncharacterized protein YbjT (DUF2867 family)